MTYVQTWTRIWTSTSGTLCSRFRWLTDSSIWISEIFVTHFLLKQRICFICLIPTVTLTSYSKILWSSATINAHFCDYDAQGFRVDSKRAAIAVGIKFKNDQLNYRACLSFIIAMFKSFWFTKSRDFTTKSFLETEMLIFTKRTFLMSVPYIQDEFRNILMSKNKSYKRSCEKIFNAVNFLCTLWVAKNFRNKTEQKEAYIRMLKGMDLKKKLKRNKDKE